MVGMKFKPTDFFWDVESLAKGISSTQMADRANQILQAEIENGVRVYGHDKYGEWNSCTDEGHWADTHQARLICIENIKEPLSKTQRETVIDEEQTRSDIAQMAAMCNRIVGLESQLKKAESLLERCQERLDDTSGADELFCAVNEYFKGENFK